MENENKMAKCPNFNHFKSNVAVRYCCDCGEVVNDDMPKKKCAEESHSKRRRDRSHFCVDCGEDLRKDTHNI